MDRKYPDSAELEHILRWHDYALYDITAPGRIEPLSWEELAFKDRPQEFLFGHKYILAPIPDQEETIRQAYNQNRMDGFLPMLRIPEKDIEMEICPDLHGSYGIKKQSHLHYLLHEFYFREDTISAFSSLGVYIRNSSRLIIPTERAVEIFGSYFTVGQISGSQVNIRKPQKIHIN